MSSPKVTVLVTSYNQEDFIGPALESVVSQDYENLEILACDDGSSDGTLEVLRQFSERDARVKVITTDHNTGVAENRNRGLRARTGELVALLDGDDLMRPGKIVAQVATLEAHPEAVGCLHDAELFNSDDGSKLGLFSRTLGSRLRNGGAELWLDPTYMVLPSTVMLRSRSIAERLCDPRIPFTCEWLLFIEVFRQGACVVLDGVYVDYRRHGEQMSADNATTGFEESMMVMTLVDCRYPELARHTRTMRTALLYGEARRHWRAGNRGKSVGFVRSAARTGGLAGHVRLAGRVANARR